MHEPFGFTSSTKCSKLCTFDTRYLGVRQQWTINIKPWYNNNKLLLLKAQPYNLIHCCFNIIILVIFASYY